ncbi:hypothetical protein NHH03_25775 [Stieleria sp. TO1_6]|uniref:hypothetical protein n=1 Tax=Stieleria tagensis TaxID=2956795 RepID=UPI00209AF3B6|nr:hypothetical protein [Stieleria tagensis]MCO8125172.1 hypothetical protein [Stieleria tagensis]
MNAISKLFLFTLVCLPLTTGCGGSGSGETVADQDELSSYLDEHGDDTDLNADD